MPLALPAELKKITPYIRRAEELDRDKGNAQSRLVAYYCRQYAVHAGIPFAQSPASKTALGAILNDLEKEKAAMSVFTREESKLLCEQFAQKIFEKADTEDRLGQSDKNTAKSFYAAASFMEILQQFYTGDDASSEREEERGKIVYAKWKATEILKAIKEGRQPTPGGYGEQLDNTPTIENVEDAFPQIVESPPSVPALPHAPSPPPAPSTPTARVPVAAPEFDEGTEVSLDIGPPPAYPVASAPAQIVSHEVFVPLPPPVTPPAEPSPSKKATGIFAAFTPSHKAGGSISKEKLADAMELTRFALAALESKDVDLAATRLQQALQTLGR